MNFNQMNFITKQKDENIEKATKQGIKNIEKETNDEEIPRYNMFSIKKRKITD